VILAREALLLGFDVAGLLVQAGVCKFAGHRDPRWMTGSTTETRWCTACGATLAVRPRT
jgi:hypothetical protein